MTAAARAPLRHDQRRGFYVKCLKMNLFINELVKELQGRVCGFCGCCKYLGLYEGMWHFCIKFKQIKNLQVGVLRGAVFELPRFLLEGGFCHYVLFPQAFKFDFGFFLCCWGEVCSECC